MYLGREKQERTYSNSYWGHDSIDDDVTYVDCKGVLAACPKLQANTKRQDVFMKRDSYGEMIIRLSAQVFECW